MKLVSVTLTVRMMKPVLLGLVVLVLANGAPQRNTLRPDGRIIGGQAVDIKDFPYQVSMNYFGFHLCGAVNIAPFFMLTAASCVVGTNVNYTGIRVGSSFYASGGLTIPVQRFYPHPQFDEDTADYDIAIMELIVGLGSGAGVSAIALPYQDQEFEAGTMCTVSGWGITSQGVSDLPDELQAVNVPIIGLDECKPSYGGYIVTSRMLCAGVPQGGLDACTADTGGPLVTEGPVLVGLVSWGLGCVRPNYPGVYTNVAILRNFIKEIANI